MEQETQNQATHTVSRRRLIAIILLTVFVTIIITAGLFYVIFLSGGRYGKLRLMDLYVKQHYYGESDAGQIEESLLRGYVSALGDPYARYYSAEGTNTRMNRLNGSVCGIGAIVYKHPDRHTLCIKHVYDVCPAADAGIMEGDEILTIDSHSVTEMRFYDAVASISHNIGETVELTVDRGGQILNFTVVYSEFTEQSVFYQLIGSIGYIEITDFNKETVAQFETAVNDLTAKGVNGLLFDLRGNGGGTVNSVTEIIDYLVPNGVIMTATYANGKTATVARSDGKEIDLPMAVLTDGATASAAEIFAASIRDFNKGILVGETTYGKGVMQGTYRFPDGSSVVLTIGEFFTHSGASFNGEGLHPDVEIILDDEQQRVFYTLTPDTDPVIAAALDWFGNHDNE